LLRPLADEMEEMAETEVRSTEEVKRKLFDVNAKIREQEEEMKEEGFKEERELVFFSQDVVGLYPSIIAEEAGRIIEDVIAESSIDYQNVEWDVLEVYLAITLTNDEKEELGINDVLPDKTRGINRKVTLNYMKEDNHKDGTNKWTKEGKRKAEKMDKKRMIGRCIRNIVVKIMKNHVYQFDGKVFKQLVGGPIGLLLTGTISRIVMLRWDRAYITKLEDMGLDMESYFRYVDDQGLTTWATPPGLVFRDGELKYVEEAEELKKPADERTANLYKDVANTIMPMIKMEEDFPSKNANARIPVLDLEVWIDNNQVKHTFYRKPMANKEVINNKSALENRVKLNILVEEGLRRMRNVSPNVVWKETVRHLEEYQLDIMEAGYPDVFRNRIIDMVVGKHRKEMEGHERWMNDEPEGRPCYRNAKERETEKEQKTGAIGMKESWYRGGGHTSVLWLPATPGGELLQKIEKELSTTKGPKGTKIKLVQKGGKTTASALLKSNPFPRNHCGRPKCIPCIQGGEEGSRGQCYDGGLGYIGGCTRCPEASKALGAKGKDIKEALYHGESSKTLFRRTLQHFEKYIKKQEKSWMWNHVAEEHEGVIRGEGIEDFEFKSVGKFKDPTTRIADEAVRAARDERGEGDNVEGTVKVLNSKDEFFTTKDVRIFTTQF
jgi:hypothetical protein